MKHTATTPSLFGLDAAQVWDTESAYMHLKALGHAETKRTAERRLITLQLLPKELAGSDLLDEYSRPPNRLVLDWAISQARKRRDRILFTQLRELPTGKPCLHANDARGGRFWIPMHSVDANTVQNALQSLQQRIGKPISVFPHGTLTSLLRNTPQLSAIQSCLEAYRPAPLTEDRISRSAENASFPHSPHLKRLEAESIHIIREAVAEARNPVMLHSLGKDSCVLLHLARKAFHPAPPPLPLLHIDTQWEFQEMYAFRDLISRTFSLDLLVHSNPEAARKNINPFDHGSTLHTEIAKNEALKQALEEHRFDIALSGARRDTSRSRAANRVFSIQAHRQPTAYKRRPEIWNIYNTSTIANESIQAFPLSNWSELDVWQYIYQEGIKISPLYFAQHRPVVERSGKFLMIDDERCRVHESDEIQIRKVRFQNLGCYPLSEAIASEAETIEDVLLELLEISQRTYQSTKTHVKKTSPANSPKTTHHAR